MPVTKPPRPLPRQAADAPPAPPTASAASVPGARRRLPRIKPQPVPPGGRRARPAVPASPPTADPEVFPGLAATLRSVPELAELRERTLAAAQTRPVTEGSTASDSPPGARRRVPPPDDAAFTLRLPDAAVRRLWSRVAVVRPGLEHFSPSPLMATAALETLVGDGLGGGWIEVRRVPGGLVEASGWVIRAHGLDRTGVARLREIVDGAGPIVAPATPPERPAHLRRHLRPTRIALAAAVAALVGLVALLGPLALPG